MMKMNNEKSEKKTAVGCLLIAAMFFFALAVFQCNEEREEVKAKEEVKSQKPLTPSTVTPEKRAASRTFAPITGENTDGDTYDDPYDDPDFDDLIPGEEYDEEFVDRSQGDPELYDE